MFTFVHVNGNVPCWTIYLVTVTAEKAAKPATAVQDCVLTFVRVTNWIFKRRPRDIPVIWQQTQIS